MPFEKDQLVAQAIAQEVVVAATRKYLLLFLFLVLIESSSIAKTKVDIVNNIMLQSGNGGKQVQDGSGNQELSIYEPSIYIDSQITPHTTIFGNFLIDMWSSASEAIFDGNTGASGRALVAQPKKAEDEDEDDDDGGSGSSGDVQKKLQERYGFNVGVSQKFGTLTVTPRLGYSYEFDYKSINGGITLDKSFADENFVVSLGYQGFFDSTHPYDAATMQFQDWQSKRTHSIDLSASQVLTKSDLIYLGYNYTNQSGFLAGSQNTVDLSGTRVNEIMPNSRNRNSINLRYVHGFTDALAVHLDYRFYFDDWGFKTHTIEPSLLFGFDEDQGLVKIFYRYYMQNASTYYQDRFASAKTYMTSDSDLAKFNAHEGGAMVSHEWNLKKKSPIKSINVSASGLYYHRSNDLNAGIFQFGFGGTF